MRLLIGLFLFGVLATDAHAAQKAGSLPTAIVESDRRANGGRAVLVEIPQTRIETSVDIGRTAIPPSGGILDTIIISSMNDTRKVLTRSQQDRMEIVVGPLRAALKDFDFDSSALAATKTALANVPWFEPQTVVLGKVTAPADRQAFIDSASTSQFAFITYRYDLSPDFTQIRLIADVSLAKRTGVKGKTTVTPFYRQRISSIAELRKRSYEPAENAAMWSAHDGELAKASLIAGFARLEYLIPYALGLSADNVKRLTAKDHESGFAAGLYGPLVERRQERVLIWSNGLVEVQPVPADHLQAR